MTVGCISNTDMCRTRGDTYPFQLSITDGSSPIDITGFTYILTVDPLQDPTNSTGNLFQTAGIITNAVGGVVEFTITGTQADQKPDIYYYDVQQTDAAGAVRTILKGKWEIKQDITK